MCAPNYLLAHIESCEHTVALRARHPNLRLCLSFSPSTSVSSGNVCTPAHTKSPQPSSASITEDPLCGPSCWALVHQRGRHGSFLHVFTTPLMLNREVKIMSHWKSPLASARHLCIKQSRKDEESCSLHSKDGKLNSERPSDQVRGDQPCRIHIVTSFLLHSF